jgi:hypothetical protein
MDDLKKITHIINKWELNKAFLAKKIGMLKGTFNNKFNPTHDTKFSDEEVTKLKNLLMKMREDFKDL